MIEFTQKFQNENGGFLHAISKKSALYIKDILRKHHSLIRLKIDLKKLDRTIVHTHPHLDEYFADLLFRSSLPEYKMGIDFMEMSVESQVYDSTCHAYWPNAAVMGIGATLKSKPNTMYLFDEHTNNGKSKEPSCSQLVADQIFKKYLPKSIRTVLKEVNEIDSAGGAHAQHIGNIMKTAHQIRFMFKKTRLQHQNIQNWIPDQWKKAMMDASITAIIYCLENNIELEKNFQYRGKLTRESMEHYFKYCPYREDALFNKSIQYMRATYSNQAPSFLKANLPLSKTIKQKLLLAQVCFALEVCWGKTISKAIMMNYWEVIYQGQAIFNQAIKELNPLTTIKKETILHCKFGSFQKQEIPLKSKTTKNVNLWLLYGEPTPMLSMGNKPLNYKMNQENDGYGFVFLNDLFSLKKAIFCGTKTPYNLWKKIVDHLCLNEPDCWHKTLTYKSDKYASFLINGNPSHRYVPQSNLEFKDFIAIVSKITSKEQYGNLFLRNNNMKLYPR